MPLSSQVKYVAMATNGITVNNVEPLVFDGQNLELLFVNMKNLFLSLKTIYDAIERRLRKKKIPNLRAIKKIPYFGIIMQ